MQVNWLVFVKYPEKKFGPKNIGLYREDGLSYFENKSGPELVKFKKNICKRRF